MSNIITADFSGGRTRVTAEAAYQWDYGQLLRLTGADLPAIYECHFALEEKAGAALRAYGDSDGVAIPDALLEAGRNIYCWIVLHTSAEDGETELAVTIPVTPRPRPEDCDAPTTAEQSAVARAVAIVSANARAVEDAVAGMEDTLADAMLAAKRAIGGAAPPILIQASGATVDIDDGAGGEPLSVCVVRTPSHIAGSGDPSPSNPWTVTGRSAVTITRSGANICPEPVMGSSYNNNTGAATMGTSSNAATPKFPVDFTAHPVYTLTKAVNLTVFLYAWDALGNYIGRSTSVSPAGALQITKATIDTQGTGGSGDVDHIAWMAVRLYQGDGQDIADAANAQLMLAPGETALEYVAYEGQSWTTELGEAVYNGALDALSGRLVVTMGMVTVGELTWEDTANAGIFRAYIEDKALGLLTVCAEQYAPTDVSAVTAMGEYTIRGHSTSARSTYIRDSRFDSAAAFAEAQADVKIVYRLAEPRTAQLTGQAVTTVLGVNHISADTGEADIIYTADTKTYIDNQLAALLAGLA